MTYVVFVIGCALLGIALAVNVRRRDRFPLLHSYKDKAYCIYGGLDNGVNYLEFSHVMMLDWDVPDPIHPEEACTIRDRNEAYHILKEFCLENPGWVFRVYETPGGVRAFLTSRCVESVAEVSDLMGWLRCDPLYVKFCERRRSFAVRVSAKLSRKGDYVARLVGIVGVGKEDPDALEVVRYHDRKIAAGKS